jgi:fumarate reductase flavoprotein subunit
VTSTTTENWDVIVIGAGTAGIPTALAAMARGAKVLLVEASDRIGGTLYMAKGSFSAAGTKLQRYRSIKDAPEDHLADCLRLTGGTGDQPILKLWLAHAGKTLDWLLDEGLQVFSTEPQKSGPHDPYTTARITTAFPGGAGYVPVLSRLLRDNPATNLLLQTSFIDFIWDNANQITGVLVKRQNGTTDAIHGSNVVLACGGYSANAEIWRKLHDRAHRVHTNSYSKGDGIQAALSAGAVLENAETYLPSFGGLKDLENPGQYCFQSRVFPQYRLPWEIYVNLAGHRFLPEDEFSPEKREHALKGQEGETFWCIYDDKIRRVAPALFAWPEDLIEAAFNKHEDYKVAPTIEALAAACGIDAQTLAATVADFNRGQASDSDSLGRAHMPRPIVEPPFYAVRHYGVSVLGYAGVKVDDRLRVLNKDRHPIPNLYAVGEMLGMGVFGKAYLGGSMISAAMTLGRVLGSEILQWPR